jgi:mono/diheme cytochrome c family protein
MRPRSNLFFHAFLISAVAYSQTASDLNLETGRQIFEAACAGCHGADGKGQPVSTLGFEPPATFPDFTDCNGSTRESTLQWSSVIHDGGRARAFSEIMPSFGPPKDPALSDDEIMKVIRYVRSFCAEDPKWPSGDFNFARPMVTEKAFPEDEVVLITAINTEGAPGVRHNLIIEKRFGAQTNIELRFRGAFQQLSSGSWAGAIGDTSFELKRSLLVNNKSGTLLAWGNEIIAPTGDPKRGLGSGITKYESFLSLGQILPAYSYVQTQAGVETPPFHRHQVATELYNRTVLGKAFAQDRGFGRTWTLAGEMVAIRALGPRQRWTIDAVPQLQVTLSRRQHVRLGLGWLIPAMNVGTRQQQFMFYLLWDTFDGGWREGWR